MSVSSREPDFRNGRSLVLILISVFLLIVGSLIASTGIAAVRTRHYQFEWEQSSNLEVGPIAVGQSPTHGVDRYDGVTALCVGIGLTAVGSMFVLWGLGGAWSFLRPNSLELPPRVGVGLCIASALLQTSALLCILPPWRMGNGAGPALWLTIVFTALLIYLAVKFDAFRRMKLWNKALVGLGIGAIGLTAAFGGQLLVGIVLAVFVCASYAVHLIFLRAFVMDR